MDDVPTELAAAHWKELAARREVDALLVLGRAKGMTWSQLGGAIGSTRQGAMQRHARATRRLELGASGSAAIAASAAGTTS